MNTQQYKFKPGVNLKLKMFEVNARILHQQLILKVSEANWMSTMLCCWDYKTWPYYKFMTMLYFRMKIRTEWKQNIKDYYVTVCHNMYNWFDPYLGQSTKHSSHWLEVQPLGAVHYNDIHAECLSQILGCLGLPSACWSLGAAPTMKMEGSGKGHVTPVLIIF